MKLRWRLTWLATYPAAKLLMGLKVSGREKLVEGPQILASNHLSNIDPLIIGWAAARELHFLAKEELFGASRFFEWLIRSWNAWPVRRGAGDLSAIRHCSRILAGRQTLVLFPEGTRSKTGQMARLRPGVAMIALRSDVPVVPTLIRGLEGSWASYLVDRDFVRLGFRTRPSSRSRIRVDFGDPIPPAGFARTRAGYVEMTRTIEDRIRGLATWHA